jgi:lipopolysaccharide export LptBFGC system permease protein LptF
LRTPEGVILRIFNGTRQSLNLTTKELSLLSFAEYQLNLSATLGGGGAGNNTGSRNSDAKGLSTLKLLLAKDAGIKPSQLHSYRAEAHQRIIGSFFPLCLTLLMYFGLTQDLRTRHNRNRILLRVCAIGGVFMVIGYGLNALNVRDNRFIWISYGLVIGSLYGCYRWEKIRIAARSFKIGYNPSSSFHHGHP